MGLIVTSSCLWCLNRPGRKVKLGLAYGPAGPHMLFWNEVPTSIEAPISLHSGKLKWRPLCSAVLFVIFQSIKNNHTIIIIRLEQYNHDNHRNTLIMIRNLDPLGRFVGRFVVCAWRADLGLLHVIQRRIVIWVVVKIMVPFWVP